MEAVVIVLFVAVCFIAIIYYANRHKTSGRSLSASDDSDSTGALNAIAGGDSDCSSTTHHSHGHGRHHGDSGAHHGGVDAGHVDSGHFDGGHVDVGGHH
jgi:hypothetical protein